MSPNKQFLYDSKPYVEHVYNIVKRDSNGLYGITETYIEHLVGIIGFMTLVNANLIKVCEVNGRKLYTLVNKK